MPKPKKRSVKNKKSRLNNEATGRSAQTWDPWLALFVTLAVLAFFSPALRNDFVWDDYTLLVDNKHFRGLGWAELRWMFSTFHLGHYQPLSWLTLALDYLVWGMNPFGYHLTNLVLHAANAVLFYFLALRLLSLGLPERFKPDHLGIRAAALFAALVFSVHPLRVESVAWATERRDVLSGFFFLAAILCYLRANVSPQSSSERRRYLSAALGAYVLSLLSKASGVGLPIVLLLLDIYPLRRLGGNPATWFVAGTKRIWLEKILFLVPAAAAAAIAPLAQSETGATWTLDQHGGVARLSQALFGLAFYLWKTLWPVSLSPLYELPLRMNPFHWPFLVSGAVVTAISILVLAMRKRWPAGLASWIYYLILLAPVLGFVQSGWQMVADRYSYLACLSWALLAGAGLFYSWKWSAARYGERPARLWVGAAAVVIVFGLGFLTYRQTLVWHNTDTFWPHVMAVTDNSLFSSAHAHHTWGRWLADRGQLDEGIKHLRRSIEIQPESTIFTDLGIALARRGELEEATRSFEKALALNPKLSEAHFNLGSVLALQGRLSDATAHLEEAVRIKPDYAQAYHNLGKVWAAQNQLDKAIDLFRRALQIAPESAEAHQSLAIALSEQGRRDEAMRHYHEALRIMTSERQVRIGK
jgi:Flp pilus assembly protein TadD